MIADDEIIQLQGVPMEWLSTLEGRKKAQKIFARNAYKLRKILFLTEPAPPNWVPLQEVHLDRTESTLQQGNEASSLPAK